MDNRFILILIVSCLHGTVVTADSPAKDQNPGQLKMALVNMKSLYSLDDKSNIRKNLDRHHYFVDKAAAGGAEFVGFPEMSISGCKCGKVMPFLKLDGPEVQELSRKAAEKGVYLSAGIAEIDDQGNSWNTQIVIGPDGQLLARHHKIWLTAEVEMQHEPGTEHTVLEVKGAKVGIFVCADGSDYGNIEALVANGATIIYGPHANITGSKINLWYNFRKSFGGPADEQFVEASTSNYVGRAVVPARGWCDRLNIYAAMHNHAAFYNPEYDPPSGPEPEVDAWSSGAWFIGPDGETLAQMPGSFDQRDCKEFILMCTIPLNGKLSASVE